MRSQGAWHRHSSVIAIAIAVAGMCVAPANAGVEIGLGVDAPVDQDTTDVEMLAYATDQRFPWEFSVGRFGEHRRRDGSLYTRPTEFASVSKRVPWHHWFVSGGVAYDTADDPVLTGHFQFQTALGFQLDRWTLSVRHLSNARIKLPNHGETFAMLEFGF